MQVKTKIEDIKYLILDKAHLSGLYPEDCLGLHIVSLNEGNGYTSVSVNINKDDIDRYLEEKSSCIYSLT